MSSQNNNRNIRSYPRDLRRARAGCTADAVCFGALALAAAGGLLCLLLGLLALPEPLSGYALPLELALAAVLLASAARFALALRERRAVAEIAQRSVYAVMLNAEEQKRISRRLSAQYAVEHFAGFALLAAPLALLLTALYLRTGDDSCLLALAAAVLALFLVAALSQAFVSARIASPDGFCTVSDRGIVSGGEVLLFDAAAGDVSALAKFDGCYSVRFLRAGFLGIRRKTEFPLPAGGSVSRELTGGADEALCRALSVGALLPVAGSYRPIRDDELWQAAGYDARPDAQPAGAQEAAPAPDAYPDAEQEDEAITVVGTNRAVKLAAVVALLAVGGVAAFGLLWPKLRGSTVPIVVEEPEKPDDDPVAPPDFKDDTPISAPWQGEDGAWYVTAGGVNVLLVNRSYNLPESFGGENDEANAAMSRLIAAAEADGISIYIVSGYRSYETQAAIYQRKLDNEGQEQADRWVARPGCSEHQTGLAFDVNMANSDSTSLNRTFATTAAYEWLTAHCAEYGFIERYGYEKEAITGYGYEPWHYRYVGTALAPLVQQSGLSLEEYLGVAKAEA